MSATLRARVVAIALEYFNTGNGDMNDGTPESIWPWRACVAIAVRELRGIECGS